jgi:hypothetical protein
MLTLHRLLELSGLNQDRLLAQMTGDQVLRILIAEIDNMATQAIRLYEVDFNKLHKLRTLANHPNTPPHERDAALAAIKRLLPDKPRPEVPAGGHLNKGKVFSDGPVEPVKPQAQQSYTVRGKTFVG